MDLKKNKLYIFWSIGKKICAMNDRCFNAIEKCANYYSYYFGNSYIFTRENLRYMKSFYLSFPIFYKKLEDISWEQYKLLLNIKSNDERKFYFRLTLYFHNDFIETRELLQNNYFNRI